jgi:hypothetical protein
MNRQQLENAIERLWKGGSAIGLPEWHGVPVNLLVVVGYAKLMAPGKLYFAELTDLSTGHQHLLRFAKAEPNGDMLNFRDKEGKLLATLAPFVEWPELDVWPMARAWSLWQKDLERWALVQAQRQVKEFCGGGRQKGPWPNNNQRLGR